MSTLFVDHLTVIDCSYLDKKRGVVGESWIVDLQLTGGLDQQSMVLDFGLVKKSIKTLIDDKVDHKLLLPMQCNALSLSALSSDEIGDTGETSDTDQTSLAFKSDRGLIQHQSPEDALCPLDCNAITAEHVARYLEAEIAKITPSNVDKVELTLHTENIDGAYYHYTHGLKKHDGNCQRIAHGHRSKIHIYSNDQHLNDRHPHGERLTHLENQIANEWQDIYIGSQEDLVEQTDSQLTFRYQAPQGQFSITLPIQHCYVMPNDSTVECIAEHLANKLNEQYQKSIKVKAYEGVKKGAIADK